MSIFDDMLKADESLFKDEVALDYSFIPKLIPYREKEQKHAPKTKLFRLIQHNNIS